MGHDKDLISDEEGKIAALSLTGWIVSKIAKALKWSRTAFHNYLYLKKRKNENRQKSGGKAKVTPSMRRKIINAASKGMISTQELKSRLNFPVHCETVRLVLCKTKMFKYIKAYISLMLTAEHKFNRTERARKYVCFTDTEWRSVLFSDEKKFNHDSPDRLSYYWHDVC